MITITSQPTTGKLMAAYRPIIIGTTIAPQPPVAYCDIYINGVLYKTISKTQPPFDFDIQDACQEYIEKYLPSNGGSVIETDILHQVYCKIRSSQFDTNGFIQPDTTGTNSNVFWAVNAALQHEDNQDLENHLNYFKNGTWANNVFPLTHRPNNYKLCKVDSDFFPVVNKGNSISCIRLNYRLKGQTNFQTAQNCSAACTPVSFTLTNPLPSVGVNANYNLNINLTGTGPFFYLPVNMPSWLNGTIIGNVLNLSGVSGNVPVIEDVEFAVTNCSPTQFQGYLGTIETNVITCGVTLLGVNIAVSGQPPGQPYYIYHAWWTNNGGTPLYVDIQVSFDNGATWQNPNNGNQTTNTDWYYDLGATIEQTHQIKLTPYCAIGQPGTPTIATFTAVGGCTAPILTGVQFNGSNDIILSWINGPWVAVTPEYSYDTISWTGISTVSPISPRNIGSGLNNTGVVYFRIIGQCNSGPSAPSNSISFNTNIVSGGNIQISNSSVAGSYISDVTPAFFLINSGAYPVLPNQDILGLHGGYLGDITVQATGADPNDTLELFINGNFVQSVYVGSMSGLFTFVNVTINPSDNVVIRLLNF